MRTVFHVHFKPIIGTVKRSALPHRGIPRRWDTTVEYAKKTVTFRYKSWLDVRTKEKSYKTVTMDIYEFMAKMLFLPPEEAPEDDTLLRYLRTRCGEKLKKITNATWKAAVEHCFNTDPEKCPDCGAEMNPSDSVRLQCGAGLVPDAEGILSVQGVFQTHEAGAVRLTIIVII